MDNYQVPAQVFMNSFDNNKLVNHNRFLKSPLTITCLLIIIKKPRSTAEEGRGKKQESTPHINNRAVV